MVIAVGDVLRGKTYVSHTLCKDEVNYLRRQEKQLVEGEHRLTERQREVLQLLAEGKVMKEIGGVLNMTTGTVPLHKYRIMEAPGAKSSAELVRHAVRDHLVCRLAVFPTPPVRKRVAGCLFDADARIK